MDTKEFSFTELKNVKIFSDFKRWKKIPCRRDFYSYEKQVFEIEFLKFIYSEKATKFCEIFTLLLSYVMLVKSKLKISQNLAAFSEYMNFTTAVQYDLSEK